jgi:hypothetical protein
MYHPAASVAVVVNSNKLRIENLNQRRFGWASVMAVPGYASAGTLPHGAFGGQANGKPGALRHLLERRATSCEN